MMVEDIDKEFEERQQKLTNFETQDRTEIDSAVKSLLEHVNGRKFLWWVLEQGKIAGNPFTNNALSTSFACGEMNVAQKVLDRIISVNPGGYAQMVQEKADERNRRDSLLDRRDDGRDE